jgi:hypothetical protein
MPKTAKGNRTEHVGVQIVEEGPGGDITMFFADYDLPPIVFSAKTGSSGGKGSRKAQQDPRSRGREGRGQVASYSDRGPHCKLFSRFEQ